MSPELKRRRIVLAKRRSFVALGIVLAAVLVLTYIAVRFSGTWLIKDQPFTHVKWAVVLEGQGPDMERTEYATSLLLESKVDTVILMGKRVYRDRNNADFYFEDMQKLGLPNGNQIYFLRHDDNSSMEEAYSLIPALKKHGGIDTVLLITRGAATRRVNQIFNRLSGGNPVFITVNLDESLYNPRTWLHTRESRKVWFKEWASLLVSKFELILKSPIEPIPGKHYPLQWAGVDNRMDEELIPLATSSSDISSSEAESSSSQESAVSSSSKEVELPQMDDEPKAVVAPKAKSEKPKTDSAKPAKSEKSKSDKDKKTDKKADKKSDKKSDSKSNKKSK